jgi:hypothetical protein
MIRIAKPRNRRSKKKSVTVRAAWIGGFCVIVAAIITVAPGVLHSGSSGPNSPSETAPPSAAPLPTTSTSSAGLDVLSSTFVDPGIDTVFVTKNTFQPTGQIAAILVGDPGISAVSILYNTGAINLAQMDLQLVLTGEIRQGIRILDITPIILKRTAPWHGDLFAFGDQGIAQNIQTSLDLDSAFPAVMDDATGRPYFEENTLTLKQGEQEVVIMKVVETRGFVAFKLRVDYLVGSQQRYVVINNHGQPFELSAANCIRKNFESYGLVFSGELENLSAARQPSQFQSSCQPN